MTVKITQKDRENFVIPKSICAVLTGRATEAEIHVVVFEEWLYPDPTEDNPDEKPRDAYELKLREQVKHLLFRWINIALKEWTELDDAQLEAVKSSQVNRN